jgi:hypothetical protein
MQFNDLIKLEFKRLFEKLPYKMEAEKQFSDGIRTSTFYHIDEFDDGIKSNLFDNDTKIDTHISLFKFDKIKKFQEDISNFNIKVVLLKKSEGMEDIYNLLFLVQKPIIKKVYDQLSTKKVLNKLSEFAGDSKLLNPLIGQDGIVSSIIDNDVILNTLIGDDGIVNEYIGGNSSVSDIKKYKIEYLLGGKRKKKKLQKLQKLQKIILKRCETFDNLYNDELNIITLKVYNIPAVDIVENILKIYYMTIFKYILPNLYFNYKDIKKIETINLEYKSIIDTNKTLDDSLKTIFFIERNKDLYNNAYPDNKYNIPYQLGDIDVIFSNKPLIYYD